MIDYIKIMNLIIAFIKSTAIPVDLDSLLNSNDIKIPVINQIMINKNILDNIISLSIIILLCTTFISCILGLVLASSEENKKDDNAKSESLPFFIVTIIAFLTILPVWNFNDYVDRKYAEIKKSIESNYYTETVPSFQLETANTLPNGTITKEDILSFDNFSYDKPADATIYDKGNLYNLPLPTILKETNVQSIKNLYDNINFLDDYYNNNYINDDRYHWINVQLNAFYNSNPTDNTNADILRNLKN